MAKTKALAGIEETKTMTEETEEIKTAAAAEEENGKADSSGQDEADDEQSSLDPDKNDAETQKSEKTGSVETKQDPAFEKVEFVAPIDEKDNADHLIIVNGKGWRIKRGVKVMIPRYVANAYYDAQKQKLARLNFEDNLKKNSYLGDFDN